MKIKVVDMTYEQALAQPPQVHKKPKKPSLLFRTVLRAASAPDLLATHFHCEKIGMAQIKSDEPCLVLMNHSCFLDLKIAEAVLYPRPFNIVCTSDGFVGKEWLMRSVGCIPTRKFCSDTTLVRDMLYCVRTLKTSVLLYPETNCQGLFHQIHKKSKKGVRSTVWLLTPRLIDYIFPFNRSLQRYA